MWLYFLTCWLTFLGWHKDQYLLQAGKPVPLCIKQDTISKSMNQTNIMTKETMDNVCIGHCETFQLPKFDLETRSTEKTFKVTPLFQLISADLHVELRIKPGTFCLEGSWELMYLIYSVHAYICPLRGT